MNVKGKEPVVVIASANGSAINRHGESPPGNAAGLADPARSLVPRLGQSVTTAGRQGQREGPMRGNNGELVHVQVWAIGDVIPAPENDDVYKAISWDDPDIHELALSIKEHGLQEPILVSRDGYIISGHRRRVAAIIAGLERVPVRVHAVNRAEDPGEFIKLLVEMNTQRIKSTSVLVHESLIKIDPKEAHQKIVSEREKK